MKPLNSTLRLALLLGVGALAAHAQTAITAGDLLVYRVGSNAGTDTLAATGNQVYIDEWTTAGTYVQSIATGMYASGTATSEGLLSSSPNGQYYAFTGYASSSTSSIVSATSTAINRTVGVLSRTGTVSRTNFSDVASANNVRGAATTNGTDLYIAGAAGGVRYGVASASTQTSTQLSTTVTNIRAVEVFGGQLYVSDSSGSTVRLGAVGSGLPTTSGQTITNLAGLPTSTGSPYEFFLADLSSSVAGYDTLYLADDAAGIQKYSLVSGTWTLKGTITAASVRGLTASVNGSTVSLFGSTGSSASAGTGAVYAFTDTTGYNGAVSGSASTLFSNTTLKTALGASGSSFAFRGIEIASFTPVPEPATYAAIFGLAALGLVAWRRRARA